MTTPTNNDAATNDALPIWDTDWRVWNVRGEGTLDDPQRIFVLSKDRKRWIEAESAYLSGHANEYHFASDSEGNDPSFTRRTRKGAERALDSVWRTGCTGRVFAAHRCTVQQELAACLAADTGRC